MRRPKLFLYDLEAFEGRVASSFRYIEWSRKPRYWEVDSVLT